MAATSEATFTLKIDGNADAAAKAAADELENLREQLNGSQNAIKQMSAQMRALHGSSDAVKAAKAALTTKIDAERDAMTKATLGKQITDQKKRLADKFKEEKAAQEKSSAAISKAGGPLGALRDKFEGLKEVLGGASAGTALFAAGATAMIGVIVAVAAGVATATVALAKFALRGADAARSARLLREAAMGANAQWGKNAGEQIDALALKVPTAKAQIDELGRALAKSHIGGQTWVDTLNAVTQASAALGDDAGAKIKEFVERGRLLGRMQINPQELIGTGVDFKDVAGELAKSMRVSVKDAQAALFEGRVQLSDGAAALRAAVEKKFGAINIRQMMSLENISKKLGEAFDALTKDVDIEPILKGLREMSNIFSLSEVSGQALKQILEVFGKELGSAFTTTTPIAKKFIYGMIIGAQQLVISYLQVRNQLRSTFGDSKVLKDVDTLNIALTAAKWTMYALGAATLMTAGFLAAAAAPFVTVGVLIWGVYKSLKSAYDFIKSVDWNELGLTMANGLVNGLKTGAIKVVNAVKDVANQAKQAFKDTLQIHSPSRVFAEYGQNIAAGAAQGVDDGAPKAQAAVDNMIAAPKGGAKGGGASVNVTVNINVAGGDGKQVAAQLQEGSTLEQITKAILDALQGAGIPVPG